MRADKIGQKKQWRRLTRAYQGKCPRINTSALAVKSGNNKIIYQDILTVLAGATNDLPTCPEQRAGAAAEKIAQTQRILRDTQTDEQ